MSTRNEHRIVTPFLGNEGRAACELVLGQRLGRDPGSRDEVLAAFDGLFDRIASDFGARFDMETDALLILALSILVWQFDKRKLERVGGALNYGRATVRCIWPLADGYCFHSLMTGRFGAPAEFDVSDLQVVAHKGLAIEIVAVVDEQLDWWLRIEAVDEVAAGMPRHDYICQFVTRGWRVNAQ